MAADEYFCNQVERENFYGVLRFFTWMPSAISIGYYQKTRYFDLDKLKESGIKVVRRITGGNAIFHKGDFTYSIILKNDNNGISAKKEFYHMLAKILKDSLSSLGVESFINEKLNIKNTTPNCFSSTSQYEIVDDCGFKLIGSAQKITKEFILQHGSFFYNDNFNQISDYILLDRLDDVKNNKNPNKYKFEVSEIERVFLKEFVKNFNLINYELSENDIKNIELLIESKYSKDVWNFKK